MGKKAKHILNGIVCLIFGILFLIFRIILSDIWPSMARSAGDVEAIRIFDVVAIVALAAGLVFMFLGILFILIGIKKRKQVA